MKDSSPRGSLGVSPCPHSPLRAGGGSGLGLTAASPPGSFLRHFWVYFWGIFWFIWFTRSSMWGPTLGETLPSQPQEFPLPSHTPRGFTGVPAWERNKRDLFPIFLLFPWVLRLVGHLREGREGENGVG